MITRPAAEAAAVKTTPCRRATVTKTEGSRDDDTEVCVRSSCCVELFDRLMAATASAAIALKNLWVLSITRFWDQFKALS